MNNCNDLINIGISLYNSSKFKEAYEKFNEALNLCSNDEKVILWKGKTELMMGKLDEAIKTLQTVPNIAEAQYSLSLALYLYSFFIKDHQKILQDALFYASEAVRNSKNNKVLNNLSNLLEILILAELNLTNEAMQILTKSNISFPFALSEIASAYIDLKRRNILSAIGNSEHALVNLQYFNELKGSEKDFIKDFVHIIKTRESVQCVINVIYFINKFFIEKARITELIG
ncbi:tetratricopeptide repeat protein [Sulfurisphaera tokodaii]|uniref:Uncharacterized protein n=2 Tax=Sulfurisphaera tokodaii TaxID=111955 RepID=Q96Z46_SULTO|nr:tetratricopeptide repeat protein [Sulfurisphaera tokodaii]BAB67080.1 hypothetical protein STK_19860 [Sulfurisphaera tokodaii str. 7]HII73806.1 tetratricopeptide repeat protein [Sulfurisphaera tokodaii]